MSSRPVPAERITPPPPSTHGVQMRPVLPPRLERQACVPGRMLRLPLGTFAATHGKRHLVFVGVAKWTEVAKLGSAGGHPALCLRIQPTRRKEGECALSRHQEASGSSHA